MLLLLEPDSEKARRFQEVIELLTPGRSVMTWQNARLMIRELPPYLKLAALISLDHDLTPGADGDDPGDGLDVARFLVSQPIIRPVIIHSSNKACAATMAAEFERAGWPYSLVPHVGSDWIEIGWKRAVKRLLQMTDPQRPPISTRAEYRAANRRRFIYVALCLSPFVLGLAAIIYHGTHESGQHPVDMPTERDFPEEPEDEVKPVSPIADKAPDFVLTAEDFYSELRTNKETATEKYKGKVIQLTGVLNKYLKDSKGVTLGLQTAGLLDVQCFTTDQQPWTTAAPGQIVTLKGRFPDSFILIGLRDCVILKVTGENRTTLSVVQLARAYASDPKGFLEDYHDTCLVLTGVVQSMVNDGENVGHVHVYLKTDSNVIVKAEFYSWRHETDRLRIGQPARIVGRFSGEDGPGALKLWACIYAGRPK